MAHVAAMHFVRICGVTAAAVGLGGTLVWERTRRSTMW
jgi:hypothetical protein